MICEFNNRKKCPGKRGAGPSARRRTRTPLQGSPRTHTPVLLSPRPSPCPGGSRGLAMSRPATPARCRELRRGEARKVWALQRGGGEGEMVPSGCPPVAADFGAGQVKFRGSRGVCVYVCVQLRGFPSSLTPRVRGKGKTNPGKQPQKSPRADLPARGDISYALNSF